MQDADGDGVVTPDEFITGLVVHALSKVGRTIDSQALGDQLSDLTKLINMALAEDLRRLWNNLSGNPDYSPFVPDERTRKQIKDIAMQRTVRGNKQYGMIDLELGVAIQKAFITLDRNNDRSLDRTDFEQMINSPLARRTFAEHPQNNHSCGVGPHTVAESFATF